MAFLGGPGVTINNFITYPTATTSGDNSRILYTGGGDVTLGSLNLGGTSGEILRPGSGSQFGTTIHQVNYELSSQPRGVPTALFRTWSRHDRIESVVINTASGSASVSNIYLEGNGGSVLGNPTTKDGRQSTTTYCT